MPISALTSDLGVVLDACVLAPMPLAGTLIRLAELNAFHPYWSERILDETLGALLNMSYPLRAAEWRLAAMRRAFPDAMVASIEAQRSYALPDPDDDHVLHVAVVSPAEMLLTHNLRDFPMEVCDRLGSTGHQSRRLSE